MQTIRLERGGAVIGAEGAPDFHLRLDDVRLRLLWARDECTPAAVRGHGYVLDRGSGPLELVRLAHGAADHAAMMALHEAVAARVLPAEGLGKLRAWTAWHGANDRRWTVTGDLGALSAALRGRALVERAGPDLSVARATALPESLLRDPVGAAVRDLVGDVRWPSAWDATTLRPRFHGARRGPVVVLTGCHYGSIHADAGQDRTAAVFCSTDGGQSFGELPWTLSPEQQASPAGRYCWPPEQLDRVILDDDGLTVEWEDPWILFEPGDAWAARWSREHRRWHMWTRPES